jgi:hypothetical protein
MRISFIVAAALAVTAALAIEPPKDKPAAPPASTPAPSTPAPPAETPAEAPAPAAEPEIEEELPPLSTEAADAGPPPQRFTPTEKVRADFPVSFPIDI